MRSLLCVVLSVSLVAAPALAQPSATPPIPNAQPVGPVEPEPEPEDGHRSWLVGPHFSLGATFLSVGEDSFDPGVGAEFGFGIRLDPRIAINGSFIWGFTEFERTKELAGVANDLGGATADGFGAVTDWVDDCSKDEKSLCVLGAIFAYFFLSLGFAGAGVLYAMAPFASTGYVGVNGTASYLLGDEELGTRLELGVTSAVLFPREYPEPISVVGPTAGVSFRSGRIRIGGRVSWFPTAIRISGERDRAALIGLITVGSEH